MMISVWYVKWVFFNVIARDKVLTQLGAFIECNFHTIKQNPDINTVCMSLSTPATIHFFTSISHDMFVLKSSAHAHFCR